VPEVLLWKIGLTNKCTKVEAKTHQPIHSIPLLPIISAVDANVADLQMYYKRTIELTVHLSLQANVLQQKMNNTLLSKYITGTTNL